MSEAVRRAMARAEHGLDWSYPCLVWVADYLADATGRDVAAQWRDTAWTRETALAALDALAKGGHGDTAVERAMSAMALREGWVTCDGARQGAVMVGCYVAGDGITGVPAIFDGQDRWLVSQDGRGVRVLKAPPGVIWLVG